MVNTRATANVLFALLMFLSASLLPSIAVAAIYSEPDLNAFLITFVLSLTVGVLGFMLTRIDVELKPKDGFVIVTFAWILFAAAGALPFYLSGFIPSYTDAFFETMSGFTTTGATILTDVERLPHGLLFWRSFTHWLGGMGIIVLSLAILPLLGVGGMQLFRAEVPGPTPDKLSPRIRETAKVLWGVYLLMTIVETLLLMLAGMNLFDALCHTFGTVATGGFSTKNTSIAWYDSAAIDYIIIVFMMLSGINFALHFRALQGRINIYWHDAEVKLYTAIILIISAIVGVQIMLYTNSDFATTVRHAVFQVVSILTTTGYGTADYELWGLAAQLLLFVLMFIGGCAGSTGGGMKIIRPLVLFKFSRTEVMRLVHPHAILPVRVGEMIVPREIIATVAGFFLFYIGLFAFGVLFMSFLGLDLETALGSVAATIGNVGPGLGSVGPTENYAAIPAVGKWFLSFLMLSGRLEIYTVIILFSRTFWHR